MAISDIKFHLSRGNPNNDSCGIGFNQQVFGKSIGGKLFRKEVLANSINVYHELVNNNYELFDPIVPTDIIKSKINYRAVFITNYGLDSILLDSISCGSVEIDPIAGIPLTDVDIAVEGLYTVSQVSRPIPNKTGRAGNPSIFLDDEYDSTGKIEDLEFKKTLDSFDLPTDIPFDACLKIWIRRKTVIESVNLPEDEIRESFTLTVNDYDGNSKELTTNYYKIKGRLSLSNWYNCTFTPGIGGPIVLKELFPQSVLVYEISNINKIFVKDDKIILFYYVQPDAGTKNQVMLIIKPGETSRLNKYIQVFLDFNINLEDTEELITSTLIDIKRSYYSVNDYYMFFNNTIKLNNSGNYEKCSNLQFFGQSEDEDIVSCNILQTDIWTSDLVFEDLATGYDSRKIETYDIFDNRIVRKKSKLINLEQIDDLFILFTQNTQNKGLIEIQNVNLNKNELLYLFEKDIIDYKKYTKFTNNTSYGSEVISHRLYPKSLPTIEQIKSLNVAKNASIDNIISNSSQIDVDISSHRTIKYLVDGTRYVDLNSVHGKEFKIGNNFTTYELPDNNTDFRNYSTTFNIAIANTENIYSDKNEAYQTTHIIDNVVGLDVYEKPLFQQNIIDVSSIDSQSIPVEWVDRLYKDEWIKIISTLPNIIEDDPIFSVYYNFHRNLWRISYYDEYDTLIDKTYNMLKDQESVTDTVVTTGSSGSPGFGKLYTELSIEDLSYVIEPDTYQPFTVKLSTQPSAGKDSTNIKYQVNFKLYFKESIVPIIDITTYTENITNLSYIFINPDKSLDIRINYFDLMDVNGNVNDIYKIKNTHLMLLNKLSTTLGKEYRVRPQIKPDQAEFKYYRKIQIDGLDTFNSDKANDNFDITIPIVLYGNGYKNDITNQYSQYLGVSIPFDFSKIAFNDKNMRFYNTDLERTTLNFKLSYYDYQKDYAVVWVRLTDFNSAKTNITMYYGNTTSIFKNDSVFNSYLYLKNNLYSSSYIGVWHFDEKIQDNRFLFNTGKILNNGRPVIFEKTYSGDIRLTQIDKEYMYGVAKVYKSNKFNLNIDIPEEEKLLFDKNTNEEFLKFVKNSVDLLKPSYTEINTTKTSGIDIFEAGEGQMGLTTNRKVAGLIAMTPNSNVSTYYDRKDDVRFNMLTSFNGYSQKIDWVVGKPTDSSIFKSGILKINGKVKTETIKFERPFKDKNYFVVFSSPVNQTMYWNALCENRFTITASHYLNKEISWMAFHKDIFGGVYTSNSIFVGSRTLTSSLETVGEESPTTENLSYWYNNELIIKPDIGAGDPGPMLIDPTDPGYSILLSSNENINMYWTAKGSNSFNVKTSSPAACTIHWIVIRNGIEWWNEII